MNTQTFNAAAATRPLQIANCKLQMSRRGFSFTELLFAVMILGIGFIMIAAIFPVGLSQTKNNFDETQAASLARSVVQAISQASDNSAMTATVPTRLIAVPVLDGIVRTNSISPSDPRYAAVSLYRIMGSTRYAQIFTFIVTRSDPFIDSRDFSSFPSSSVLPLEARPVRVSIINGIATIDSRTGAMSGNENNHLAAAPGSYLIIDDDALATNNDIRGVTGQTPADQTAADGRLEGRVYRLGVQQSGTTSFELFPGSEFNESFQWDADANPANADKTVTIPSIRNGTGFIIGRNRISATEFDGSTMDVAYYTTFVTVN